MRTNPFGTRLTSLSIGAYGVLAKRWGNVPASAEADRGHWSLVSCWTSKPSKPRTPDGKLSRKSIGKSGWDLSRFRFGGNFPTRLLIDIDRLHQKKRCFLQNNTNFYYSDRTPWLSKTSPISRVLFYRVASYLAIVRHFSVS